MREYVEELIKPVHILQYKIRKQIELDFVKVFETTEHRLSVLEQTMYGKDGPENRFEKIEKE